MTQLKSCVKRLDRKIASLSRKIEKRPDLNIARLSQAVTYFHSPKETPQKIKKLLLMKNKLQRPKTMFFITPFTLKKPTCH